MVCRRNFHTNHWNRVAALHTAFPMNFYNSLLATYPDLKNWDLEAVKESDERQKENCLKTSCVENCDPMASTQGVYDAILNDSTVRPKSRKYSKGGLGRNRFGRPYVSGRPLLLCDRLKIVELYLEGLKKIEIARKMGITHSCVSKIITRFLQNGTVEPRQSRTASCACPGSAHIHDERFCRKEKYGENATSTPHRNRPVLFSIENLLTAHPRVKYSSKASEVN